MALRRCSCSRNALEVFIQDIAGLALQNASSRPKLLSAQQQTARRAILQRRHNSSRHNSVTPVSSIAERPTLSSVYSADLDQDSHGAAFEGCHKVDANRSNGHIQTARSKVSSTRRPTTLLQNAVKSHGQNAVRLYSTAKQQQIDDEGDIVAQLLADADAGIRWNEQPKNTEIEKADVAGKVPSKKTSQPENKRDRHNSKDDKSRTVMDRTKRHATTKASGETRTVTRKVNASTDLKDKLTKEIEQGKPKPDWLVWKEAMKKKLNGQAWNPRKRVSPDSMNGIRALHAADPETYNLVVLGEHLQMSTEAVRRILRSKWQPSEKEAESRRLRWERRGEKNRAEIAELDEKKKMAAAIRRQKAADATKQVRNRFTAMRAAAQVSRPADSRDSW